MLIKRCLAIHTTLLIVMLTTVTVFCRAVAEESSGLVLEAGRVYYMKMVRHAAHVPTIGKYSCMQGGGRDGKYAYYAMIDGRLEAIIHKYDIETWDYLGSSDPMPLGHANDITYNIEKNQLMVAYCSINRICFVDPDSLSYLGFERTGFLTVHRLEYLAETGRMLFGGGYTLSFYKNGQYNKADSYFLCGDSRFTTQGLTCDGQYVYDVRFDADAYGKSDNSVVCNYIVVHDMSGNYIGTLPIYGITGEAENIIVLEDGFFALGCNGSDDIFIVEICESFTQ